MHYRSLLLTFALCVLLPQAQAIIAEEDPATTQIESSNIDTLRRQATRGDSEAQFQMGLAYSRGNFVHRNYQQAKHWFQLAADQHNIDATYCLGLMYLFGSGGPQQGDKAVDTMFDAAAKGQLMARAKLAQLYKFGYLVPHSPVAAYALYTLGGDTTERDKIAKDLNSTDLKEGDDLIAQMQRQDNFRPAVDSYVHEVYLQAATDGDSYARYILATLYAQGRGGVSANPTIAYALCNREDSCGLHLREQLTSHQLWLSYLLAQHWNYALKDGLEDYLSNHRDEYLRGLYIDAANSGDHIAVRTLADIYAHGQNVDVDHVLAYGLYVLAGDIAASKAERRKLTIHQIARAQALRINLARPYAFKQAITNYLDGSSETGDVSVTPDTPDNDADTSTQTTTDGTSDDDWMPYDLAGLPNPPTVPVITYALCQLAGDDACLRGLLAVLTPIEVQQTLAVYQYFAAVKRQPQLYANLGVMYEYGIGVHLDPIVAYAFYLRAHHTEDQQRIASLLDKRQLAQATKLSDDIRTLLIITALTEYHAQEAADNNQDSSDTRSTDGTDSTTNSDTTDSTTSSDSSSNADTQNTEANSSDTWMPYDLAGLPQPPTVPVITYAFCQLAADQACLSGLQAVLTPAEQQQAQAVHQYFAADQHQQQLYDNLGVMYEYGIGVHLDPLLAHAFYSLAHDNPNRLRVADLLDDSQLQQANTLQHRINQLGIIPALAEYHPPPAADSSDSDSSGEQQ